MLAALRPLSRRSASSLIHQSNLNSSMPFSPERKTKIVCTIGPASLPRLPEMLLAGMNVARINCAHGDRAQYAGIVRAVREAEGAIRGSARGSPAARAAGGALCGSRHDVAAIAFDIKGPEIRVGRFGDSVPPLMVRTTRPDGSVVAAPGQKEVALAIGDRLTLTTDAARANSGSASELYVSYPALASQARPGQIIFVDDGNVELRVLSANAAAGTLLVESQTSAPLGERKNVNLPGLVVDLPAVTAKDLVDLATARDLGATFIFASFVQSAAAVRAIRAHCSPAMRIISKIESQEGLDNYDEILAASDGIMVARGDLGVQIPAECVVLAQKMMIARANVRGKPIICATQMLDSMMHHPRPTRAEVVDVASAVLDGADAVMLSGETAKGEYPLEAVGAMARACVAAEAAYPHRAFFTALSAHPSVPVGVEADEAFALHEAAAAAAAAPRTAAGVDYLTASDVEALGASAVAAAMELRAAAIVVLSLSGRTAAAVAKYRPAVPVLCLVADEAVAHSLQLCRGVHAVLVQPGEMPPGASTHSVPALRTLAMGYVKSWGLAREGDRVVLCHGSGADMTEGVCVTVAKVH
jgi:pyruvate kinase